MHNQVLCRGLRALVVIADHARHGGVIQGSVEGHAAGGEFIEHVRQAAILKMGRSD